MCKEADLEVNDDTVPFDKLKDSGFLYVGFHKVDKTEAREGLVISVYGATYFLKSFLGCSVLRSVRHGGFCKETSTWHGLRLGCLEELLSLAMTAGLRVVGTPVDGRTLDPWSLCKERYPDGDPRALPDWQIKICVDPSMKAKNAVPATGTPVFQEIKYGGSSSSGSADDVVVPTNISTVRCGRRRRLFRPYTKPRSALSPAYRLWKSGICKPITIVTPLDRSLIKHMYTTPRFSRFRASHPFCKHHRVDCVVVHNPAARPYPIFEKKSGDQWDQALPGDYDGVWVVRDISDE